VSNKEVKRSEQSKSQYALKFCENANANELLKVPKRQQTINTSRSDITLTENATTEGGRTKKKKKANTVRSGYSTPMICFNAKKKIV
jgi:hypothetical protein